MLLGVRHALDHGALDEPDAAIAVDPGLIVERGRRSGAGAVLPVTRRANPVAALAVEEAFALGDFAWRDDAGVERNGDRVDDAVGSRRRRARSVGRRARLPGAGTPGSDDGEGARTTPLPRPDRQGRASSAHAYFISPDCTVRSGRWVRINTLAVSRLNTHHEESWSPQRTPC